MSIFQSFVCIPVRKSSPLYPCDSLHLNIRKTATATRNGILMRPKKKNQTFIPISTFFVSLFCKSSRFTGAFTGTQNKICQSASTSSRVSTSTTSSSSKRTLSSLSPFLIYGQRKDPRQNFVNEAEGNGDGDGDDSYDEIDQNAENWGKGNKKMNNHVNMKKRDTQQQKEEDKENQGYNHPGGVGIGVGGNRGKWDRDRDNHRDVGKSGLRKNDDLLWNARGRKSDGNVRRKAEMTRSLKNRNVALKKRFNKSIHDSQYRSLDANQSSSSLKKTGQAPSFRNDDENHSFGDLDPKSDDDQKIDEEGSQDEMDFSELDEWARTQMFKDIPSGKRASYMEHLQIKLPNEPRSSLSPDKMPDIKLLIDAIDEDIDFYPDGTVKPKKIKAESTQKQSTAAVNQNQKQRYGDTNIIEDDKKELQALESDIAYNFKRGNSFRSTVGEDVELNGPLKRIVEKRKKEKQNPRLKPLPPDKVPKWDDFDAPIEDDGDDSPGYFKRTPHGPFDDDGDDENFFANASFSSINGELEGMDTNVDDDDDDDGNHDIHDNVFSRTSSDVIEDGELDDGNLGMNKPATADEAEQISNRFLISKVKMIGRERLLHTKDRDMRIDYQHRMEESDEDFESEHYDLEDDEEEEKEELSDIDRDSDEEEVNRYVNEQKNSRKFDIDNLFKDVEVLEYDNGEMGGQEVDEALDKLSESIRKKPQEPRYPKMKDEPVNKDFKWIADLGNRKIRVDKDDLLYDSMNEPDRTEKRRRNSTIIFVDSLQWEEFCKVCKERRKEFSSVLQSMIDQSLENKPIAPLENVLKALSIQHSYAVTPNFLKSKLRKRIRVEELRQWEMFQVSCYWWGMHPFEALYVMIARFIKDKSVIPDYLDESGRLMASSLIKREGRDPVDELHDFVYRDMIKNPTTSEVTSDILEIGCMRRRLSVLEEMYRKLYLGVQGSDIEAQNA